MNQNHIPCTYEARCKKLEEAFEVTRKQHEKMEPYITAFLDNALCKSIATDAYYYQSGNSITISIYDVDLPTVIDHICGPIHRKYNVDWKLNIPYNDRLVLTALLPKPGQAKPRHSWAALVEFTINLYERSMKSCEVIRVKRREKMAEEITRSVQSAADPFEYEYRIDCGGE